MRIALLLLSATLLLFSCKTAQINNARTEVKQDSLVSQVKQVEKSSDSTYTEPASKTEVEVEVVFDSVGVIKPFRISINKGSSHLEAYSKGGNKIVISDSCGATIARFMKLNSEQSKEIANLKTRFVMEAHQKVDVQFKTPFWNWIIIGVLLSLIGILFLKNIL